MKRNIVESYSIEEAFRALNKKPQRKVVESVSTGRTFAQVANVVPFKDFISGKSMIYFLQDFAGSTGELYMVAYNGDIYGLDTGNEIANYICGIHEITSYDDLAEFANYSPDDIDSDVKLYGEKNIPVASFNYDGLNVEEFINRFELEPPRITENRKASTPVIPAPYDTYFEVIDPTEIAFEDGMIEIGEKVDGATILAYLGAKDEYLEYFDSDAFLIDDEACPVVEIAHGRCYPIDIEEIFN